MSSPLVSIIVITYNSHNTILETLESIYKQPYRNIELVISDDCSTDNTLTVCGEWLDQNRGRFVSSEMITTKSNTGISANCNRGWKAASGIWIKLIAGDDILADDCIEKYIEYTNSHKDAQVLSSSFQSFVLLEDGKKQYLKTYPDKRYYKFFYLPANQQYRWLLTNSFNVAPSTILKKEVLEKLNGFDEEFPFLEDLPLWLKITGNKIKMNFLQETTVYYRIHKNSIRISNSDTFFNKKFKDSLFRFKRIYIYPNVPFYKIYFWQSEWAKNNQYKIITRFFLNKKSIFTFFVYYFFLLVNVEYIHSKVLKFYELIKK